MLGINIEFLKGLVVLDGVGDAEWVVSTEHHLISADEARGASNSRVVVAQGIVVDHLQVLRRGLGELVGDEFVRCDAAIEAASKEGESSARVSKQKAQLRESLEHTRDNELADGGGGLEGETESQVKGVAVAVKVFAANTIVRVNESDELLLLQLLPNRVQGRVIESLASTGSADNNSLKVGELAQVLNLVNRGRDALEREDTKSRELAWVLHRNLVHVLIEKLGPVDGLVGRLQKV
jgi:hypothetical protein